MAEDQKASDFDRTLRAAKERAGNVVDEARSAARDVTESATDAFSQTASSFERLLRKTIEEQPYTALLIGIGIGWVLGRSHRPF